MQAEALFLKSLVFLQEFNPLTSSSLAGPFIPRFYLLEFARERVGGRGGGRKQAPQQQQQQQLSALSVMNDPRCYLHLK